MAFYASRKPDSGGFPVPDGEIYDVFREQMIAWIQEIRAMPKENMEITSFDGLKLRGRFYEYAPGAPIELMFHGYRGKAERDLSGGVQQCFALGRSALIVDQRACGESEGHVITFGINESRDCHSWLAFMQQRFGPDVKIIITGISMGAATVMLAAGRDLPPNVVGVLADCGYTSARDIIQEVIRGMKLPPKLAYPFVRLGARLYGHFSLDSDSPIEAMKRCKVPVIFFHGDTDAFVPCEMSRRNYAACAAPKALVEVPGAGHGLAYLVDPEGYLEKLNDFSVRHWGFEDRSIKT
jgi:alpha-beta hydrolase superfamily lysophospholipase